MSVQMARISPPVSPPSSAPKAAAEPQGTPEQAVPTQVADGFESQGASPRALSLRAPAPSAPRQDLKVGSRGAAVEQLQKCLVHLGHLSASDMSTGPGIYGPRTQAAVARLQAQHGITGNNGENYGPRTRAVLEKALQGAGGTQGPTPPAGGGRTLDVPQYGQKDPRWAGQRYLFGGGTVGQIGCTLTSIAMAAQYATKDSKWTPGYLNAGHYGEALNTLKQENLGKKMGHPLPSLYDQGSGFIRRGSGAQEQLLGAVRDSLRSGHPVVLGMGLNGANGHIENGWTRHTVVAVGVASDGDILLNDPATGGQTRLSSYMNRPQFTGFDRATAILN
jgi:peptidoglycan hydrolase-like protein with peptidoglycan-binding domain